MRYFPPGELKVVETKPGNAYSWRLLAEPKLATLPLPRLAAGRPGHGRDDLVLAPPTVVL